MRPRYVINKGIKKTIKVVSRRLETGTTYIAAIYNRRDTSTKITDSALCSVVDSRRTVVFVFPGVDTNKLKVGTATIEIYDSEKNIMIFRDDFAVIRPNSLPITDQSSDESE